MHDKMKDLECVTHKVKIAPLDYSKENYLATFTPQKQLTPEKIFWSQDIIKMKAEALKMQATTSRPIKALTMYPPNTPATLVPRVLPTKSQVKINIFALIQLFSDFEKTCNKRITQTGLTEGERGFEQTKACYLTEVIIFFKTLKEYYEGIQKALTKEIKEMKYIFEKLEIEVDQNGVDRKHDEIEQKNHLIANDNLIADCLSKEVFYVATNSKLNITRAKHLEQTTALLTENESLKVQIQNKLSCVNKDHVKPKVLAPRKYAIDVEPIPPRNRNNREVHLVYLKHLKESVETLREIVEEAKVERPLDSSLASACRYTKHSQELLEYVIGTCPKEHAPTPVIRKKQVTFEEQCDTSNSNTHKHVEQLNTQKTNVHVPPSTGVNCRTDRPLVFGLRLFKTYDGGSLTAQELREKFIGTVIFWNDHFSAIMGYRDYVIGDSVISRSSVDEIPVVPWVKFIKIPKDETPEVLIKFLKQIQVGLNKTIRYIRTDNGTEFVNKDLTAYYERVGIFHQKTVPRTPQQNGVVERRNRTLVEAARTMLIFSKALMFLWAEAVATACYTQNRSLIHTLHNKTPYELVHDKKPDLTFFRVFGALCYPTNDSEDPCKITTKQLI
ncbi:integrase, catalytic region, zinc finger, CCHC-type containing protein [Tanacetum coccineum]